METRPAPTGGYELRDGMYVRDGQVAHDQGQYDSRGFDVLTDMQQRHFWYRGRHRFLAAEVRRSLPIAQRTGCRVMDLGAGCGGWIAHVSRIGLFPGAELALGDSSLTALRGARLHTNANVSCFQIDLLDLGFDARWDAMFLLDVIEHLDDDLAALQNAYRALAAGGLLFVTVPAFQSLWSWNDDVVKHKRRYDSAQLSSVAQGAGFEVIDMRYFMFLLSPFLVLSRAFRAPHLAALDDEAKWALVEKTHRVPARPINNLLSAVLALETPLSNCVRFPWGTSLLGVLRRP
jgi:SAM-dependent methyltransferase